MTSVVAILNREGVALAADSAVTRNKGERRGNQQKLTKNGNKMIRLNSTGRVSIMITGNADFLGIPWDVLSRRYRDLRGTMTFETVEDVTNDFFDFISSMDVIWAEDSCDTHILEAARMLFSRTLDDITDVKARGEDGQLLYPSEFSQQFAHNLERYEKEWMEWGVSPQFQDYTSDIFRDSADDLIDDVFDDYDDRIGVRKALFPRQLLEDLRPSFTHALMVYLTTRREDTDDFSELVFSGYGEKQDHPSLVAANVFGGMDRRVNYHIRPEDIVRISDDRPVAICPFAQDDVVDALLECAHPDWIMAAKEKMKWLCSPVISSLFSDSEGRVDPEILKGLYEIRTDDLLGILNEGIHQHLEDNRQEWEETLVDADIKSMALLAESLIELTGFHRVLTFAQEGVGGLVDLAFIPRSGKFTWLNRKSWYHQKLFCGNVTSIVCNSN